MARYNIVVMGRTGVGKSSLINYLFGSHVFETGTGNPVTTRGFHRIDLDLDGIPATLYDSCGLEVGKDKQWLSDLGTELAQRGVEHPVEKWFHTVFYLIQAPGHRIENFEKEVICKFLIEKYRVVVVFTKAELVSEECITQLHEVLRQDVSANLSAVAVCSVRQATRIGETKPFGAGRLIVEIFQGFWESIIYRVPGRCISIMIENVVTVFDELKNYIKKETGHFNQKKIVSEVQLRCDKIRAEFFGSDGVFENIILRETKNVVSFFQQFEKLVNYGKASSQATHVVGTPIDIRLPDAVSTGFLIAGAIAAPAIGVGVLALMAVIGIGGGSIVGPLVGGAGSAIMQQQRESFVKRITESVCEHQAAIEDSLRKSDKGITDLLRGCLSIEYHETAE